MKKVFVFLTVFMLLPMTVLAEEKAVISCEKTIIKNNEEMNCKIEVTNLNYIVTSVAGKVNITENLEIVSSSYDSNTWKIFDNNFDVKNINLISESIENKEEITIATFKVKAINNNKTTGGIAFNEVVLGDDEYNDHDIQVETLNIELDYEEVIEDNPSTGDYDLIIFACTIVFFLSFVIISGKKVKGVTYND